MHRVFILSCSITAIYTGIKLLENKYIEETEPKPLKIFARDVAIVFLSAFICSYVVLYFENNINEMINIITNVKSPIIEQKKVDVFNDEPGF